MRTAAIIGCGKYLGGMEGFGIAYAHASGWLKADPEVRLLGVDVNHENLENFGKTYNLPPENLFLSTGDLYASLTPEFVDVCTWPGFHAPMVTEAASKGVKGILCEKPMALNRREMQQMMTSCEQHGTRLAIAHQRRHNPRVDLVKDLLARDFIGTGLVLEARLADNWDMLSYTVHWFDLANYIYDALPEWVLAGLEYTGQRRYQHAVENASVVLAQYPQQRQAVFITGPDNAQPYPIVIRGSQGLIQFQEDKPVRVFNEHGYQEVDVTGESDVLLSNFGALIASLIVAVETGKAMRCDVKNCVIATEMAYAAHESARTLKQITLPLGVEDAPLERVKVMTD